MADEKKIRVAITGDASGLNAEIDRAGKDMKKAFSDVGLGDVLRDTEKKFKDIQDRMKAVGEVLKDQHNKTARQFDIRYQNTPLTSKKQAIDKEQEKYMVKENEAWDKWRRLGELLETAMRRKNEKGESGAEMIAQGGGIDRESDYATPGPHRSSRQRASLMARMISRVSTGDVGGAVQEGVGSPNGLLSTLGANASLMMVVGALGTTVVQAIRMGYEGVKLDNKISAKKDFDFDKFSEDSAGVSKLGLSINEFKDFTLQQMQSMKTYNMDQSQVTSELLQRVAIKRAYGLTDGEVSGFDQFKQQDKNNANSTQIIADILMRSEKNGGILGVSGSDFSLLPQKIQTVESLLSQQKTNNETVSSDAAVSLMMAGQQIGGRFADDRAGDAFGRIGSSIKSPGSAGMKAYIFEMLKRAHPNESYTDILARQEGGASQDNLKDILPQISKMPQGEYRRMVLYQFTKNWQDAIRLDETGGMDKILHSQNLRNVASGSDLQAQFEKAKGRGEKFTTSFENWMSIIKTTLTESGTDIVGAIDALGKADHVQWINVGGIMMTVPVPPKANKIVKPNK